MVRRFGAKADGGTLERLGSSIASTVTALIQGLPSFFQLAREVMVERGQRADLGSANLRITSAVRAQPLWSEVEIAWDDQHQRLLRLVRDLAALLQLIEQAENPSDEWQELSGELAAALTLLDQARERLWSALIESDPATIGWLSVGRNDELYVNAAPMHVGEHLREQLFSTKETVVLTSATLTTEGSFRYLRDRLGLTEARELLLGSPFDYLRSTLVYLPSDIPEPNSAGYQQAVESSVGSVISALDGRTLVLFTSYSQLRSTYQSIKEPLEARQIVLLGQRMDGASRARLLDSFKSGDRVALMGTTSFWEGVDVVGEALSCLIITRLPFSTPNDPVFQARSEAFDDPFTQYAVPQAIIRFRQGFGRLIRSRADRGILVVLDRRIKSRGYGRAFLRSLPSCEVREGPARGAGSAARDWLSAAGELAGSTV
jgi:DNA polymerase-3 subunit epsilon/ATP-dependent DNA helicase DinG